jgi:hypothetical protein
MLKDTGNATCVPHLLDILCRECECYVKGYAWCKLFILDHWLFQYIAKKKNYVEC